MYVDVYLSKLNFSSKIFDNIDIENLRTYEAASSCGKHKKVFANIVQKTKENHSTWGTIVVNLNFFVPFLGELKI